MQDSAGRAARERPRVPAVRGSAGLPRRQVCRVPIPRRRRRGRLQRRRYPRAAARCMYRSRYDQATRGRAARFAVPCGNDELGSATPEVLAGDPAVAGRLDHSRRHRALRHRTLVGPRVRRTPSPRFVLATPNFGGRLRPLARRQRDHSLVARVAVAPGDRPLSRPTGRSLLRW